MSVWELENNNEAYKTMENLIEKYHKHLKEAKIVIYANDKSKTKGDKVIIAESSKASNKLKASINADFTITLYVDTWSSLSPDQKQACLDHELTHCGVQYEPIREQIGLSKTGKSKTRIVRDEYGRVQYTSDIKRDENGVPKWKLVIHDLEEFRDIVRRHGMWDEDIQRFKEVLDENSKDERGK